MDLHKIRISLRLIFSAVFVVVGLFVLFPPLNNASAATESTAIIRENCALKSIPTATCYTSLSAWETAEQRDLVAVDQIAVAQIEGTWMNPDTTAVTINGWITDATRYIKIFTTTEARHTGKWDNTKYRLENGGWGVKIINNQQNYTKIEGLQILHSGGGGSSVGIYSLSFAGVVVKDSIIQKSATVVGEGLKIVGTNVASSGIVNSIAYGGWNFGINIATSGGYGYAYNTTSYGNNYGYNGFYIQNLKNCIGASNAIADFARDGSYAVNTTTCASSDATANIFTDTGSRINQTFSFVAPASGDFHLSTSDTSARDAGTNLSADPILAFSTDIDGDTRSGSWDIGADETSGGRAPLPPPVLTDTTAPVISSGAPSATLASATTQTTLSLLTDENATCKYSATANTSYTSLVTTFTGAGTIIHTATVSGLTSNTAYTYYVRCQDAFGNQNDTDYAIAFSIAPVATPPPGTTTIGAPVLNFSDITSGPKTGNTDGLGSGAIVSIWGNNLGPSQNTSQITIGGVPASHVYYWGNADGNPNAGPAVLYNSYQKMQTISFALPAGAPDGLTNIQVVVGGVQSNTLPFTVRAGNIYFVKTTGVDANGRGSWASPFKTLNYVNRATSSGGPNPGPVAGDIIYIADDVTNTDPYVYYINGTAEAPISLIAYPGSRVTILTLTTGWGPYNHGSVYWNVSKITIKAGRAGLLTFRGMRAVGVEITNYPGGCATGQSGAIANNDLGTNIADTVGGGIKVYGAYIHDFGCNASSKLHHVFYISNRGGVIQQSYELGWNYLTDNKVNGALHIYDENVCGDFSGAMKIHDNVVVNQSSAGFDVGSGGSANTCFSMEVQAYNNIFVNVGLINPGGDIIHAQAVSLNGWNNRATVKLYNNTFYGFGDSAGSEPSFFGDMVAGSGGIYAGWWEFKNNIIINTKNIAYIGPAVAFKQPNVMGNNIWYNPSGTISAPTWDSSPITSNPLFINPALSDFRLQSTSPAINAGSSLVSALVTRDFDGISRPQGSVYDIGAYEYYEGSATTTTPPPTQTVTPPITTTVSGAPALNFSDIVSGPKIGNTDGLGSGAIISIWGNNLGSAQGSSQVYVGGVPASHVYYWGNADGSPNAGPADLYSYHKMQTISFAVPAGAPDGATYIHVVVGGAQSNTLPFTVRSGNIYFIKTGGNNANAGSWQAPWGTLMQNGNSKMTNGDIVYAVGTLNATGGTDGLLIRYNDFHNTAERPTAVIGYPGSSVYLNGSSNGIGVWNAAPYPEYWVFSKLKVETGSTGISSIKGMRAIANEITGPLASGQSGAISGSKDSTSGVKSFGNYIHDFGLNSYDIRLHHVFYLSNRDGTPNDAYELGWNYLLNNHARGGLHNYDEGICGDFTGIIKVHDNVVVNQSGTSFDVGGSGGGYDGTGCLKVPFEVYNNLFINSGQPPFSDPAISVTFSGTKSHIKFYNNTIYGWSSAEAVYIQDNGSATHNFGGTFEWVNNIVVDTNNLPYSHSVYYKIPSINGNNIWYNGGDGNPSTVPAWDPTGLSVNPLFVNPSGGDFRLQSISPVINAGSSLVSGLVLKDINGAPRPQGSAYDIGAYEYYAGMPTTTTSQPPVQTVTPPTTTSTPSTTTQTPSSNTSYPATPASSSGGGGASYTPSSQTVQPSSIKEGSLIRGPDGIKVYIVNAHGYKRHIFNPAIFAMYGHFKWHEIKEVDQKTLDSFFTSDLYRADGDTKVFSLHEIDESKGLAQKRWFKTTAEWFQQLGYTFTQVFIINPRERDYYQEGMPITG